MPGAAQATEETKKKLEEAEQQKAQTESELDETNQNLSALNDEKGTLEGELYSLNTQLSQVSDNLSELETQIAEKEAAIADLNEQIEQTEADLADAIATKDAEYEKMKLQIRFLYEKSDDLYLEMFLSAGSFSEMLNRSSYIEQLSAYEQKTLQSYQEAQEAIEDVEAQLEQARADLTSEKEELDEYQVQVVAEQSRVSGLVSQTSGSISAYADQISDAEAKALAYEQQIKEQEENIAALNAQLQEEIRLANLAATSDWRDISEISFADGDRYLLANLIYCEAGGEPYEGQVAVGAVVINRVLSSVYPDTIVGVIYQSGQFAPVASGRLALALAEGKATQSCYNAADAAMSGTTNVGNCVYFRTPIEGITPKYTIGGHIFY